MFFQLLLFLQGLARGENVVSRWGHDEVKLGSQEGQVVLEGEVKVCKSFGESKEILMKVHVRFAEEVKGLGKVV